MQGFEEIKSSRFYKEKNKFCFIGNDVIIHCNTIIYEGVEISDGVIIYPNSVVDSDIPPYAIAAGNPARIIGYRFEQPIISELSELKWWELELDFSEFQSKENYFNVEKIIFYIKNKSLSKRHKKIICFNWYLNITYEINTDLAIIGPSHIKRWRDRVNTGALELYSNCYFWGVNGLSIYSKQLNLVAKWLSNIFKFVVIFVPDFRVGNSIILEQKTFQNSEHDCCFIYKDLISYDNNSLLYNLAIEKLKKLSSLSNNVKFVYWSLFGRELENIENGKYFYKGSYNHPHWNYNDFVSMFPENSLELKSFFHDMTNIVENDHTIHPTLYGYKKIGLFLEDSLSISFDKIN